MALQSHSWAYIQRKKAWKDTCTPKFTETLFTTARTWKQPKYPLAEKWIKVWYVTDKEGMDKVEK